MWYSHYHVGISTFIPCFLYSTRIHYYYSTILAATTTGTTVTLDTTATTKGSNSANRLGFLLIFSLISFT